MLSRLSHLGRLQPETLARFAGPVTLLLVLVLAYQLAGLTITLLVSPVPNAASQPVTKGKPPPASQQDFQQLAQWQLFGAPQQTSAPTPAQAPPTRLDLNLGGIVYRTGNAAPLALIAAGQQPETVYRIGDTVAGARIHKILPDRVLLTRNGHLETLQLPRSSDTLPANAASDSGNPAASDRRVINATGLASKLRRDPATLQDLANATPYWRDGRFVGLRLAPGPNRRLLNRLGLRPGDVLVALDGHPITSPAEGVTQLQQLLNAPRVKATILRDGNQIPMTFVLQ